MKTLWLQNRILNYMFGKTAYNPPNTYKIALWKSLTEGDNFLAQDKDNNPILPTDGEMQTTINSEPTGYNRIEVDNNTTTFGSDTTNGKRTFVIPIQFDVATQQWVDIKYIVIFEGSGEERPLFYQQFNTPITINIDEYLLFPAGSIIFDEF